MQDNTKRKIQFGTIIAVAATVSGFLATSVLYRYYALFLPTPEVIHHMSSGFYFSPVSPWSYAVDYGIYSYFLLYFFVGVAVVLSLIVVFKDNATKRSRESMRA